MRTLVSRVLSKHRTLYFRISATFLLLLSVLAGSQYFFTLYATRSIVAEADQRFHHILAQEIAARLEVFLRSKFNKAGADKTIKEIRRLNPRIEVYLLDQFGIVRAQGEFEKSPSQIFVDLEPIRRFLKEGKDAFPILGDDPKHVFVQKPFSAASVRFEGHEGFVYVILGGEEYSSTLSHLERFKGSRVLVLSILLSVVITALLGMLLFFKITRRVELLTRSVEKIFNGTGEPIPYRASNDEVGKLALVINEAASSLLSRVHRVTAREEQRTTFVAGISHDLRGPLTAIKGYTETLMEKLPDLPKDQADKYLGIIYKNTEHLIKLIEQVFDLVKFEALGGRLTIETISAPECVQDTVMKYKPLADRKGVQLQSQLPQGQLFTCGDVSLLFRALSNLVENAIKYTPEGGSVVVYTKRAGGKVWLGVSDTGQGISEEELPFIFERFYRAKAVQGTKDGSSGLGLFIVKKILEAHESTAAVYSQVGKGTTIEFPLKEIEAKPSPPLELRSVLRER